MYIKNGHWYKKYWVGDYWHYYYWPGFGVAKTLIPREFERPVGKLKIFEYDAKWILDIKCVSETYLKKYIPTLKEKGSTGLLLLDEDLWLSEN